LTFGTEHSSGDGFERAIAGGHLEESNYVTRGLSENLEVYIEARLDVSLETERNAVTGGRKREREKKFNRTDKAALYPRCKIAFRTFIARPRNDEIFVIINFWKLAGVRSRG